MMLGWSASPGTHSKFNVVETFFWPLVKGQQSISLNLLQRHVEACLENPTVTQQWQTCPVCEAGTEGWRCWFSVRNLSDIGRFRAFI